jgi:hypothetical protein
MAWISAEGRPGFAGGQQRQRRRCEGEARHPGDFRAISGFFPSVQT